MWDVGWEGLGTETRPRESQSWSNSKLHEERRTGGVIMG